MSYQSTAPSSGSNFISLANQTIGRFTSGLPRRSRHLHSGIPCTLVRFWLSLPLAEPLKFHNVDPVTIPHVDDNLDWVNAPIPVSTPIFQTSSPVTDCNLINNQLAEAL